MKREHAKRKSELARFLPHEECARCLGRRFRRRGRQKPGARTRRSGESSRSSTVGSPGRSGTSAFDRRPVMRDLVRCGMGSKWCMASRRAGEFATRKAPCYSGANVFSSGDYLGCRSRFAMIRTLYRWAFDSTGFVRRFRGRRTGKYDVILRGGTVFDGSGDARRRGRRGDCRRPDRGRGRFEQGDGQARTRRARQSRGAGLHQHAELGHGVAVGRRPLASRHSPGRHAGSLRRRRFDGAAQPADEAGHARATGRHSLRGSLDDARRISHALGNARRIVQRGLVPRRDDGADQRAGLPGSPADAQGTGRDARASFARRWKRAHWASARR